MRTVYPQESVRPTKADCGSCGISVSLGNRNLPYDCPACNESLIRRASSTDSFDRLVDSYIKEEYGANYGASEDNGLIDYRSDTLKVEPDTKPGRLLDRAMVFVNLNNLLDMFVGHEITSNSVRLHFSEHADEMVVKNLADSLSGDFVSEVKIEHVDGEETAWIVEIAMEPAEGEPTVDDSDDPDISDEEDVEQPEEPVSFGGDVSVG